MTLENKIQKVLEKASGHFGVAIKHLERNEEVTINGDEAFELASCFKVPVMATVFRDIEEGKFALNTKIKLNKNDRRSGSGVLNTLDPELEMSVRDLAMLMIVVSDNVATDKLMELVGLESTHDYMHELGLNDIQVPHNTRKAILHHLGLDDMSDDEFNQLIEDRMNNRNYMKRYNKEFVEGERRREKNTGTPKEMNRLLEMIAKKELISETASDEMIEILSNQKLRDGIPYLLPIETKVACKTGFTVSVVNDVGIVYLPDEKGTLIVSILSNENKTRYDGDITIARIAKAAFDHYVN